jgi:hypothetical protein
MILSKTLWSKAQTIFLLPPLIAATTPAAAQQNPAAPPSQNPASPPLEPEKADQPHKSGSGTEPPAMGATGWTGGSRGTTHPTDPTPDSSKDQPTMATGKDLEGPPKQFPPNQTPE